MSDLPQIATVSVPFVYHKETGIYQTAIELINRENHMGVATTPSRALTIAATHWVCQYEPEVAEAIRMVDEITERADSLGLSMCAYDTNDIKALLQLVRGERPK